MERQELIDFLRENLSVEVTTSRSYDYDHESVSINISLGLINENGSYEEITSSSDTISINN